MTEPTKPRASEEVAETEPAQNLAPPEAELTRRQRLYRVPLLGAIAYLVWPPRTKKPTKLRRFVSWTSTVVAILGIGMVAYPWAGERYPFVLRVPVEKLIEWSNFLSDMESNRIQGDLEERFAALESIDGAGQGDPLTRLVIPKIGVDTIVVEGTSTSALKAGAGHYPRTPLPGAKGNVAIAGHRTTYGRPFNKVDALRTGDQIVLSTPVGSHVYEVMDDPWVTHPSDWSVIEQPPDDAWLTLTSCHPKGSARQRLIVRAKLIRSEPAPAKAA